MGGIPGIEQNYQYGQYEQYGRVPFGSLVTPRVGVAPIQGETGISIPHNHSYTTDVDGITKVALGQDGVGLTHCDEKDYGFMLIA